jgi:Ras-related protein Rab-32
MPPKEEYIEKTFKIVVVGDVGVGKSALICKYVKGVYTNMYRATIGVDFATKQVCDKNIVYNLQLWDIAGQERFGNMTRIYVREASAAVVVCDITRPQTYHNAVKWKNEVETHLGKSIPTILVINKNDLKDTIDPYSQGYPKDIVEFVEENGFAFYQEISVKLDMEKIENIFYRLIDIINADISSKVSKEEPSGTKKDVVALTPKAPKRCCY